MEGMFGRFVGFPSGRALGCALAKPDHHLNISRLEKGGMVRLSPRPSLRAIPGGRSITQSGGVFINYWTVYAQHTW